MSQFAEKVVLVTGGTSGIGRATAQAFAREGAKVVITGRREKEGLAVAEAILKDGGQATFFKADAAIEADAKAAVDFTVQTYGRLDMAFNNAGIEGFSPITEQTEADYQRLMNINVGGVLWAMKYEIPALLQSGGGSIVNNASVVGVVGMANASVYVASKHAVVGLTKSAALEYARKGIRVNAIGPGAVQTEMVERATGGTDEGRKMFASLHPVGRIGTADEMASAVLYLSSPGAGFITGATLLADGGWSAQ